MNICCALAQLKRELQYTKKDVVPQTTTNETNMNIFALQTNIVVFSILVT